MKNVIPGILNLIDNHSELLTDKNIGFVVNQASVFPDLQHTILKLSSLQNQYNFNINAVFGPQHGLWGHTQDNMIEWEGERDSRFPYKIYSLYGKHRHIPEEWLKGIDTIIYDIQDVGARYYTFIWTLANIMKSIERKNIELIITDRPNPINAESVEGPVLEEEYSSFVGLHPFPIRHGMTVGEIGKFFQKHYYKNVNLAVIPMINYKREYYYEQTGLPWVLPSPNMPTPNTAVLYPGMCLLEGTNLSEGRGTTRPFEIFGAPFIDGMQLCEYMNSCNLPGVFFRFHPFQPVFNKFKGEYCEGAQIHVADRKKFKPFLTTLKILQVINQWYPEKFKWKESPYEYEYEKLPIDILLGNGWLRQQIENNTTLEKLVENWQMNLTEFKNKRNEVLIY